MADSRKEYVGETVAVSFDAAICQHAAECVKGLPEVFNTRARPSINIRGAEADRIMAVVDRCPSGALQYRQIDPEMVS